MNPPLPKPVPIGRVVLVILAVFGGMILISLAWLQFAPIRWKYGVHRRCGDRVIAFVEQYQRVHGTVPEKREHIPIECRGGAVKYEVTNDGWTVFLSNGMETIATYDRSARLWRFFSEER